MIYIIKHLSTCIDLITRHKLETRIMGLRKSYLYFLDKIVVHHYYKNI